jgi:hypothetical protein
LADVGAQADVHHVVAFLAKGVPHRDE